MRKDSFYFKYNKANFQVIYTCTVFSCVYFSALALYAVSNGVTGELKYPVAKEGKTTELVKMNFDSR